MVNFASRRTPQIHQEAAHPRLRKVKKEDEEDATLASKKQLKKKKDISKIKCFQCGEMGHYSTQCPIKKKEKYEKHDPQVIAMMIEED